MATKTYSGTVKKQKQIMTLTIASNTDAQTFIITMEHPSGAVGADITIATVTASSDTTSTIAADLQEQFAASSHAYAKAVTATVNAAVITLTANVAGVPFLIGSQSGTGTITEATTQANAGPNSYDLAGNWVEGSIPAATDDVTLDVNIPILYGLDQSGVAIDAFTVGPRAGVIGWPGAPLKVDPDKMQFSGKGLAYINIGSAAISPRILGSGNGGGTGYGLHLVGSAIATLNVSGASVGLGMNENEVATATNVYAHHARIGVGAASTVTNYRGVKSSLTWLANTNVTVMDNDGGAVQLLGSGVITDGYFVGSHVFVGAAPDFTNYRQSGGTLDWQSANAVAVMDFDGGSVRLNGIGAITTLYNGGAEIIWNKGNITTVNNYSGIFDSSQGKLARTIGTFNDHADAVYVPPSTSDSVIVTITTYNQFGKKRRITGGKIGLTGPPGM